MFTIIVFKSSKDRYGFVSNNRVGIVFMIFLNVTIIISFSVLILFLKNGMLNSFPPVIFVSFWALSLVFLSPKLTMRLYITVRKIKK
jgi:hypothetical protein